MVGAGGIAILPAAPVARRSRDVEYRFRQDSDFYYLTGFAEPEAVAVLAPGRANGEFLLFCRERDRDKELWDGHRAGPEGAVADYGADDAFPIDDIDDILPGIIEACPRVYFQMGLYADFDARITEWVNSLRGRASRGSHTPLEYVALDHLLHDMVIDRVRGPLILEMNARPGLSIQIANQTGLKDRLRLVDREFDAEADPAARAAFARQAFPAA